MAFLFSLLLSIFNFLFCFFRSICVKVVELTAYHVRIPLRRTIRHASHSRDSTDNVVVRCILEDGTEGYGEGVPREYVTGETIDLAMDLLAKSECSAQLGDLSSCRDFQHVVAAAERLRLAPVPNDARNCQGNAARCALELALLDAYGKRFGEPLAEVSKLLTPELYEPRPWVRYSGAILSANTWFKLRLAAIRMRVWRFPNVKVKVGIPGQDDVYRLKNIRLRLGWKKDLRVDANEAWSRTEAADRIRELQPFQLSAVEQPVPHVDVDVLQEIRQKVRVPIMLDESLCSQVDAEKALEQGTCDLYNLRLSKCGGFIPTLRLAQFARKHGLGYQLGCQVGESAVLSAAGRQFATSVAHVRYLEGSYDRHLVRETLAEEDITFRWGGWAPALDGGGLGIHVDKKALARTMVRQQNLIAS
jgi:muconate cycloisomerase